MGWAKQQHFEWFKFLRQEEDARYEEAQSRLRMSTLCKDCMRELEYPLFARIVELAISAQAGRAGGQSRRAAPLPSRDWRASTSGRLPRELLRMGAGDAE